MILRSSGVIVERGILSDEGILLPRGIIVPPDVPIDPLAGVVFALRLQTHAGDNVPVGLYQDVLCTVPATADGDLIAAWRDELGTSGLTYLQSVELNRPTLKIIGGVPVVRFNGTSSRLELLTAWGISSALTVISCRVTDPNDYSIFTNGTTADSFWRFSGDGNGYFGLFRSARINGYPAAMPVDGSHIFSVSSGTDYEVHLDGVSKGVQAGAFSAITAVSEIGWNSGVGVVPFGGDISAIWIVEDLATRELLEANVPATP